MASEYALLAEVFEVLDTSDKDTHLRFHLTRLKGGEHICTLTIRKAIFRLRAPAEAWAFAFSTKMRERFPERRYTYRVQSHVLDPAPPHAIVDDDGFFLPD